MTKIIRPGAGILYMKVGTHAQESLADIIARKTKEIEDTGYGLWGYGGNTCHPTTMVQPFAEEISKRNEPIFLVMQKMESNHLADQVRAAEFSADSMTWAKIPNTINVLGSRYALKIKNLRAETHVLPLDQTRVAVGPCTGRLGSRYIKGRVDKACFEVLEEPELTNKEPPVVKEISLVAELVEPYAVFLRT